MGSGSWSTDVYTSRSATRAATGTSAFAYSDTTRNARPRTEWKVHSELDPKLVAGPSSPLAGQNIRESRDMDDHPESVPVAVIFDVTGSMSTIPRELQKRLPALLELLQYKQYVPDAQVLFGAVGDATCDRVPLQVGQFESDNRLEDCLGNIFLEGGGGGQNTESYELAFYFMARHTAADSWEKRGKKGYLFMIGDETAYPAVKPREVKEHIGDDLSEPISTEAIIDECREKYETFFIVPGGHTHHGAPEYWKKIFGQNCLIIDDVDAIAETIALQIGIAEETIQLEEGIAHLKEHGTSATTLDSVSRALTTDA